MSEMKPDAKNAAQNDEELKNATNEIKKLQSSLKNKEAEIQEKDKKINELQQQMRVLSDLQEKLKEKDKLYLESNTKVKYMEETIKYLTSEAEKKTLAIATMRDKIKMKNEEENDPLEIRKLQNQVRGKDMELDQAHAKIDNLNEAFQRKCTELNLTNEKIHKLKMNLHTNEAADETVNEPSNVKPETITRVGLKNWNEEMVRLKQELQSSLKSKEAEIQEKDKKINELQQQTKGISDVQGKLKEKDKLYLESNTKIKEMEENIKHLTIELEKKNLAITTMRDKIKKKNEEKNDPLEIRKLQNQVRGKDMELDQAHAKIDNLNEAFQMKCIQMDLANKELYKLRSNLENNRRLNLQSDKAANDFDA